MPSPTRTWPKRVLLGSLVFVLFAVVAFFTLAPGIVERSMNKVVDGDLPTVSADTRKLHNSIQIADMHSDTLMWNRDVLASANRGHMDLPRLQKGNVALQVFSSVTKSPKGQNYESNTDETDAITLLTFVQLQPPKTWNSLLERSLYHAHRLEHAAEESEGQLRLVRTKDDLASLLKDREAGKDVTGAMFSVEGLHNLEGKFESFEKLYDAGMRMAGFTHFFDNEVAGSMHGVKKGGLTDLGRQVFAEMEKRGVIVDIAHASHTAVAEMLAMATKPVVASHGGVQATCDVNRNLTDEEIRGVAATGGVIGIGYWDAAVCDLTPAAVVDAIEHVIEVGGLETAALGSDYDGATTVAWDTSDIAVITQELRDRGHSDEDIAAIMGGNTFRVMSEVLPN
ncbi:microsomal dipeptidase-like Zn-dependent dipeptidase [Aeromicrobium panaciterrae]|uniref:Microsomal dipeptidase-like Zn-dependent dipeptidase n=1 Tax=Aeromicrobium panaciterrae TaxID=363861 RepID=A0ABU1UP52_9ACTN|nr:dipeptidase [Aeromicrobium panaciterrae]MDR7086923.1 microsomal dipeptidase-like Zn-dependent dipeptidase [Aeromicrobium panaciterrae]